MVTTVLWGDLGNRYVWVVLVVTVGFGGIGWYDDWQKVVHAPIAVCPHAGISGLSAIWYRGGALPRCDRRRSAQRVDRSLFPRPFPCPRSFFRFHGAGNITVFGTSNAVNLTDETDGLGSIMPTA